MTDKIYLDMKLTPSSEPSRLVIGLYGNDAPQATSILKQLASNTGLPSPCKPLIQKQLIKEQLEANKVYNACVETIERGVNYDLATVWRVIENNRIDVGAVAGKFLSREFPNFIKENSLSHDAFGIVSVRIGNESGFGFTINTSSTTNKELDRTHVVVGRVLDGMELVKRLNQVPVVTSARIVPTSDLSPAPSRSCRYGGSNLYCNEYKPLQKVSITQTGVL